jgi:putative ABC transport system permease protein
MTTFRSDVKLAIRMLSKNPGFTAIAVATLALGIAVNATMFSLVSAFLLRRPAASDPDRVAVISSVSPAGGFLPDANSVSAPNYLAWRQAHDVFTGLAAADEFRTANLVVPAGSSEQTELPPGSVGSSSVALGQPEAVRSAAVSSNYFRVLGVSTQVGRTFADGEDQPGHNHVVILSHDLWVRRFAADRAIVGRSVRLNREDYTVVGVMPKNFQILGFIPQLWTPLVLSPADQTADARKDRSLYLFGRLKPRVTLEQARAQFVAFGQRAAESFPEVEKGWGAAARTLPDFTIYTFGIRNGIAIMMTTVGFVLMIACANVAGLLLSRAAGRRKELAIRISLGAGRFRIVRQLLTEGLLIALLGGATGLLLSDWGIRFIHAKMAFNEYTAAVPITLDRNVLLFAVATSLVSAVLCSLAPALKASRADVNASLKDESRSSSASRSQTRLRTVLVACEIALALVLLIGTGILIRGIFATGHQNLGFRPDHLLTANVTLDDAHYKQPLQQTQFVQEVISRLQQTPGIQSVAATSDLPATGPGKFTFQIQDQPELPNTEQRTVIDTVVTSQFFDAASIPLLRGRLFKEMDHNTMRRVVVVNQKFVDRYFQGQEPLGKQIRVDVPRTNREWCEIVGVVGNVKTFSQATRDEPEVYEAFLQRPVSTFSFVVHTSGDPGGSAPALRQAIAQVDAELPLSAVMTMPAVLDRQKGGDTLFSQILGLFALLALVLAAIGIYGLIAYSVGQRTHEIGIRMAMGAGTPHVLRMVVGEGMKVAAIGAAAGFVLALPLPKLFQAMFYDFPVTARGLYVLVPGVLLVISALATYFPARRATQVDPFQALRQE